MIFRLDVRIPGPTRVLSPQEGDYQDAAETEKGTAGIPRRVGIPAAAALKSASGPEVGSGGWVKGFAKGGHRKYGSDSSPFQPRNRGVNSL